MSEDPSFRLLGMEKELPQEAGSLPKCRVLPWLDGSSHWVPSSLQFGVGFLHLHPIPRLRRGSTDLSAWLGGWPGPRCELNKHPPWLLLFSRTCLVSWDLPGVQKSWPLHTPLRPASGLSPTSESRVPRVTGSSASQAVVYKPYIPADPCVPRVENCCRGGRPLSCHLEAPTPGQEST